jgi:transcriptional antiterminator NusG
MALAPKDQWFVVHVLSGQEQKVKDNIDRRIITDENVRCRLRGAYPD